MQYNFFIKCFLVVSYPFYFTLTYHKMQIPWQKRDFSIIGWALFFVGQGSWWAK